MTDITAVFLSIWWIPVFLRFVLGFGVASWILKKVSGMHSRTRRFFLQYCFCVLIAISLGLLEGELAINSRTITVAVIGFFNGMAAFCQWKALDISLSKTSLFTFWDDIIAMGISYVVLNEGEFLNGGILAGIILSLSALVGFCVRDYRKTKSTDHGKDAKATKIAFFIYVGAYSVIWGIALFFMRYFAFNKMPAGAFLPAWYSGALIAAVIILLAYTEQDNGKTTFIKTVKEKISFFAWSAAASSAILVSLGITYWSYWYAPQIVVQPLYLVGEMIVPAIIGLFAFKERQEYEATDWTLLVISLLGGVLIAISFKG